MRRSHKVIIMVGLVIAGIVGCAVVLASEGLDRCGKVISIVAACASVLIGGAGLLLAWWTWRRDTGRAEPRSPTRSSGVGAVAINGDSSGAVSTHVSGVPAKHVPAADPPGVTADGDGSV